jgi:hypothetical protein
VPWDSVCHMPVTHHLAWLHAILLLCTLSSSVCTSGSGIMWLPAALCVPAWRVRSVCHAVLGLSVSCYPITHAQLHAPFARGDAIAHALLVSFLVEHLVRVDHVPCFYLTKFVRS